jgi:hypothetical protein
VPRIAGGIGAIGRRGSGTLKGRLLATLRRTDRANQQARHHLSRRTGCRVGIGPTVAKGSATTADRTGRTEGIAPTGRTGQAVQTGRIVRTGLSRPSGSNLRRGRSVIAR